MKNLVWTLFLSCGVISGLHGDTLDWTTSTLPPAPAAGVNVNITVGAGPATGETTAVWADSSDYAPYYSIYDNGTWTTGSIPLTAAVGADSIGVYDNVYVTSGPNAGELVATWNDYGTETPYYSVYSGGVWTTGAIALGSANGAYDDVNVTSGPESGQVTATWTNVGGGNGAYYSIFNGTTWSTGTIDLGTSTAVKFNVFVTQGPTAGTVLASWADRFTSAPYYSIYSGGVWTTGTIPLGPSAGATNEVIVAQGPSSGEIVAVWTDAFSSAPYYSIYSGGSWSTGAAIPLGDSTGANHNVYAAPGMSPGTMVATWTDSSSRDPYYAVFEGGSWTTTAPLPLSTSAGANTDVTISRLLGGNGLIAAWANQGTYPYIPYYSYVGNPAPLPPTNGTGKKVKNRFPLMIQWYNQLAWAASVSPEVTGYNIRRNGTLIAEKVTSTFYTDYNRPKNGTDLYTITSVDGSGIESLTALQITVQ